MESAVQDYLDKVESPTRRRDAETLLELMGRVTGEPARMWGSSVIGFGQYHCRYESGREGDAAAVSFAPRKAATTIYLLDGVGAYADRSAGSARTPPAWAVSTSRTCPRWTWACSRRWLASRTGP